MTLISRVEQGSPDQQRELLWDAFSTIWPQVASGAWDAIDAWYARQDAFDAMLDAEAYLSAAETLVPEGWGWGAGNCSEKDDSWASVTSPHGDCLDYDAYASTPALALLAAILWARESQSVQPT